jgi:hypothetical protein
MFITAHCRIHSQVFEFARGGNIVGLSLKKEEMAAFLEETKVPGECFRCMLWGTVRADPESFRNQSVISSLTDDDSSIPGVVGSEDSGFCYIGLTDQSLYVVAVNALNTSMITGRWVIPFVNITALSLHKGLLGNSYAIGIEYGERIDLTVKSVSIGTNIKDQKERMKFFVAAVESLKARIQ